MSSPFSSNAVIREGWALAKPRLSFLALATLVCYVAGLPFDGSLSDLMHMDEAILSSLSFEPPSWKSVLLFLAEFIVDTWALLGLLCVALRLVRGEVPTWGDILSQYRRLASGAVALFLFLLMTAVGFLLFLIPGCIWSVEYSLFPFVLLEGGAGPVAALKRSAILTKDARWELSIFYTLITLINLAGALALIVGLLVTIPVTMVMAARVYEILRLRAEEAAALPK